METYWQIVHAWQFTAEPMPTEVQAAHSANVLLEVQPITATQSLPASNPSDTKPLAYLSA